MGMTPREKENQKLRRLSLKEKGMCVDCGDYPAKEGKTLCSKCLDSRSNRYYARKAAKDKFMEENGSVVERKMEIAERLYRLRRMAA